MPNSARLVHVGSRRLAIIQLLVSYAIIRFSHIFEQHLSYHYTVAYQQKGQTLYTTPLMASTKPTQAIINPLVSNEVEFKGLGWGDDMMMINLTVGREPVRLTKEKPSHKVPYIFTPGSNIISYRGTVAKRSGPADIPETHRPAATTIEVGDAPQWFSVQINSELVHWEREGLKAIQVDLYRVGGPHDGEQFAQMLLPTAPQPVYWGFEYNTGDKAAYRWGAAYYYRDGVKKEIQPTSASETILTLPAQP